MVMTDCLASGILVGGVGGMTSGSKDPVLGKSTSPNSKELASLSNTFAVLDSTINSVECGIVDDVSSPKGDCSRSAFKDPVVKKPKGKGGGGGGGLPKKKGGR